MTDGPGGCSRSLVHRSLAIFPNMSVSDYTDFINPASPPRPLRP